MKNALLLLFSILTLSSFSQTIFWTETFGTGCNQGLLYSGYFGPNGSWSIATTGVNAGSASTWYVSAMENGNEPGACGSGCGNDRTMHIGIVSILGIGADQGASYYEGIAGLCGFLPCGATDKRVQSPTINCTGQTNITLDFDYIEGGNTLDNATLWYYNGSTWSQLADPAKTFDSACSPQGLWTHYTIALPASADNNANVRIGFRWINNENGDATDPSIAVDDIELSVPEEVGDTEPPVFVSCAMDEFVESDGSCSFILGDYTGLVSVTDNVDPDPDITQSPVAGILISSATLVTITATDDDGNFSNCTFTITPYDALPPQFDCPIDSYETADENCALVVPDFLSLLTVNDNCDAAPIVSQEPIAGTEVYEDVVVLITAMDASGNSSSCSFTVFLADNSIPEITCPGDVTVVATELGATETYVEVPEPITSDNCTYFGLYNDFNLTDNASDTYPVGTTVVNWYILDTSQNENECQMSVTVEPLPCCEADFDCNGVINVSDLLFFMSVFGILSDVGDLTNDGIVNITDLLIFMAQFGSFCP